MSIAEPTSSQLARRYLIAGWGVGGVLILLGTAIGRLTPVALEPIRKGTLGAVGWILYVLWAGVMAYSEGYRGFQRAFSPRVVVRAFHLAARPRPLHVLLAPAFCMGFFHATRKRKIVAWCMLVGITGLVVLVRQLPQPWRGVIDAGVVVGLAWGFVSILIFFWRAVNGRPIGTPADLPEAG